MRTQRRARLRTAAPLLRGLIGAAIFFLIAQAVTDLEIVDPVYLPHATTILSRVVVLTHDSQFLSDVLSTFEATFLGLCVAILVAVPAGVVLGSVALAYRTTRVVVEFMRPIPGIALIPLAILLFGAGLQMKVLLAFYACVWPLLLNTIYGVHDVDPLLKDTARVFGIRPVGIMFRVVLPSAAPYIATGIRIASAIALIVTVGTELIVGTPDGIGAYILLTSNSGDNADLVYAAVVISGLLGYLLNRGLGLLERRALRNRQETVL